MSQVWRFLHPNYRHWVDIYITDASVSMLNIQLLEHTYAPGMEIPIPELPSLGRHIYHRCVSLYAEHTIIEKQLCHRYGDSYTQITVIGSTYIYHGCISLYTEHAIIGKHLCPRYGDSYTRITAIGSTYISQMCQSLWWAYNYWNTPMSQLGRFLYPNYRHWVDIYIYQSCASLYAEHTIIERHLCLSYGDSYTRISVIGSTYISHMRQLLCWACNYWKTPMSKLWRFLLP